MKKSNEVERRQPDGDKPREAVTSTPQEFIKTSLKTIGGDIHEIEFPIDMEVKSFINELVIALQLPLTDAYGHTVTWVIEMVAENQTHRFAEGERLADYLKEAKNAHLVLMRRTFAGG